MRWTSTATPAPLSACTLFVHLLCSDGRAAPIGVTVSPHSLSPTSKGDAAFSRRAEISREARVSMPMHVNARTAEDRENGYKGT